MKRQRGFAAELVLYAIILGGCLVIWGFFANWECKSKWDRSGMRGVAWGPVQGCLINLPDGRWLPEERIREIDIPKAPDGKATDVPR
jgi:hypothetical protein